MELKQKTGWAASVCIAIAVVAGIVVTPRPLDGADAFNLNTAPASAAVPENPVSPINEVAAEPGLESESTTDVDVDAALFNSEQTREAAENSQSARTNNTPSTIVGRP